MERDNFTCRLCGDIKTTLNVHHTKYSKTEPWDINKDWLITLCEDCHNEVNNMKSINGIKTYWYDFNKDIFKIVKCDDWDTGIRVMFISFMDIKIIRVYDENGDITTGLNFTGSDQLEEIAELLAYKMKKP